MPRHTLSTKRKSYKSIPTEVKKLIIEQVAIEGAITQSEAARRYGHSTSTVKNILDIWYTEGRMEKKKRKGKRREEDLNLFDDVHAAFITTLLDEDCTTTLNIVKQTLEAEFPDLVEKNISTRDLWHFIREHIGFTLRRIETTERQNTQAVIDQRYDYLVNEEILYESNCIFVDEADFHSNPIRAQLSKKDSTSIVSGATKRANHLSVLVGISYYGVDNVVVKNVQGRSSDQIIKDFISGILYELDDKNAGSHFIVIDPTLIDKSPTIEELFANSKHRLWLLPPYSPFLNPVEECFSQLKTLVKRTPNLKGSKHLTEHIEKSVYKISQQNCKTWIDHSIQFFPSCIYKQEIN